jgi:hypothetical protein
MLNLRILFIIYIKTMTTTTIIAQFTLFIQQSGNSIQYRVSQSDPWTPISVWPATILNSNSFSLLFVRFETNLTMPTINHYFIMGTPKIVIGQNDIITVNINNVINYPGLFQNGTLITSGQDDITISNLSIFATGNCSIADHAGWVGHRFMNKNAARCQVINCNSSGPISSNGGGIFGSSSSGNATKCYSINNILNNGGGIFGSNAFQSNATNCYSLGVITQSAGGIYGSYAIQSNATNCYSQGSIGVVSPFQTLYEGGIFGSNAFQSNAYNCYSSGDICGGFAGGIYGPNSSGTAFYCYSSGAFISGSGISGAGSTVSIINSLNTPLWIDTIAASTIGVSGAGPTYTNGTLTTQGTTWIDINLSDMNTPWLLKSFDNQLYSPNSTTIYNSSGITSNAITTPGVEYQIIDVNNKTVNTGNFTGITPQGAIRFANLGAATYIIRVLQRRQNAALYGYQINTFTLTIPFTNFTLSPTAVNERALYSGTFASDSSSATVYSILAQPWDNMYVSGNSLNARYGLSYRDFQNYPVQISGTSNGITVIRTFAIQIVNLPDAPIEVFISNNQIPENSAIGSVVGTLQTYDLDPNESFTYVLVSGNGSQDNFSFTIQSGVLYTAREFNYASKNTYSIRVKSTDKSGLSVENSIALQVILPKADSFELSVMVGTENRVVLNGLAINDGQITYQITRQPQYGSFVSTSTNGVYLYRSNVGKQDNFQYVAREGTMTSSPATVIINNFTEEMVANLPRNMGTLQFNTISVNQRVWTFGGLIATNSFAETDSGFKIGNMTLSRNP